MKKSNRFLAGFILGTLAGSLVGSSLDREEKKKIKKLIRKFALSLGKEVKQKTECIKTEVKQALEESSFLDQELKQESITAEIQPQAKKKRFFFKNK